MKGRLNFVLHLFVLCDVIAVGHGFEFLPGFVDVVQLRFEESFFVVAAFDEVFFGEFAVGFEGFYAGFDLLGDFFEEEFFVGDVGGV